MKVRKFIRYAVMIIAVSSVMFYAGVMYTIYNGIIDIVSDHIATLSILGRTDTYYCE